MWGEGLGEDRVKIWLQEASHGPRPLCCPGGLGHSSKAAEGPMGAGGC